jgi:indolepyruvate decarboxylase
MRSRMPLGDFLVAYLRRAGVTHIFGLPGDLVLGLFHRFGSRRDLEIVTLSHEPAVGFAADGYARSTRKLGVVCVTYGAGGYNVVNPIAGAYAEQVPLLVVSGGPGDAEQKLGGVHHQAKDIEGQCRVFAEVTCHARILRHPELVAREIHDVVTAIASEHRPGYIEIHRDTVDTPIPVPKDIVEWDGSFPRPGSDRRKLGEAVGETAARIRTAKSPILIGGVELFRERAERDFLRLAEKLGVPVVTTVLAKGVFPMDHPQHMGIHIGPFSAPKIQVLRERSVWAANQRVNVSFHTYTDVTLKDFVAGLVKQRLPRFRERVEYCDNLKRPARRLRPGGSQTLSINDLLVTLNEFLAEHPGYDVFAESGDSLFGGLELRQRAGGLYFAQGYYASMGFAVPAAMGAQLGTGRRPLVLCGDGGFQMTGSEISHAPRLGLSPVVVLVNNSGWGIFRPVSPRQDLLDLPAWPYAELARAWGGVGVQATSRDELLTALTNAHGTDGFALIECIVPPTDISPVSRRYIRASVRKGGGS